MATKKELKAFVEFPFKLYKENDFWVPPIIRDEVDTFNPKKNPSYEGAEAKLWLAYQNKSIVGRIAGIKHGREFEEKRLVRFGWIDFIDNQDVSNKLLKSVEAWAIKFGAKAIHGPLGFSDMDLEGLLVEGFDSIATIATIYNYPYYKDHLKELGFHKAADWIEFGGEFDISIDKKLTRAASFLAERFEIEPINLRNSKEIKFYGMKMFEVINKAYLSLYGFYPLRKTESAYIVKKYLSYVKPQHLSFIKNNKGELIAFGVTMPSLSTSFQKARGKLFPFGVFHIIRALLFNKDFDLYLIGVHPDYINTGAISLVFYEIWKNFKKINVKMIRANPVLDDNERMIGLWKAITKSKGLDFNDHILKRRRCFIKTI